MDQNQETIQLLKDTLQFLKELIDKNDYQILNSILPLIGVIIGGLLSPYVTSKMENVKIRKSIKPRLIQQLYLFFNYRKMNINELTLSNLASKHFQFLNLELSREDLLDEHRIILQSKAKATSEKIDENRTLRKETFSKLTEIESTIISLIFEVRSHYGENTFTKVYELVTPYIDASNVVENNDEEIESILKGENPDIKGFGKAILAKQHNFDEDFKSLSSKLTEIKF